MPEFRILSIFNRYLQYGGEETMAAKIAETDLFCHTLCLI